MNMIEINGLYRPPPLPLSVNQTVEDRIEISSLFAGHHFEQLLEAEIDAGPLLHYNPVTVQTTGLMVPATMIYAFKGGMGELTDQTISMAGVLSRIFPGIIVSATVVNWELSVNGGPAILHVWTSDVHVARHVLEHWEELEPDDQRHTKGKYMEVANSTLVTPGTRRADYKKPGFIDTSRLTDYKKTLDKLD